MLRKPSIIVRLIAIILVMAFSFENILWANPEMFQRITSSDTLQVQSSLNPIVSPELHYKIIIEFMLRGIVEYVHHGDDLTHEYEARIDDSKMEKFNFRLTPRYEGVQLFYNFDKNGKYGDKRIGKYNEGENWVIPCAIFDRNYIGKYEAVIHPDKTIVLRKPGREKPAVPQSLAEESHKKMKVLESLGPTTDPELIENVFIPMVRDVTKDKDPVVRIHAKQILDMLQRQLASTRLNIRGKALAISAILPIIGAGGVGFFGWNYGIIGAAIALTLILFFATPRSFSYINTSNPIQLDSSVIFKDETNLQIPYWHSPLYELQNQYKNARAQFKIEGFDGMWVPLYDKAYNQLILAHIKKDKKEYKVLPDYFVFRLDTKSKSLLLDKQLRNLGMEPERLLYFPCRDDDPIPLRIPMVEEAVNRKIDASWLIGWIKSADNFAWFTCLFGEKIEKRRVSIWTLDPLITDLDRIKVIAQSLFLPESRKDEKVILERHKPGARVVDVIVFDPKGKIAFGLEFGRHTVLEHSRKGINVIRLYESIDPSKLGGSSGMPKRFVFAADEITLGKLTEDDYLLHGQKTTISRALSTSEVKLAKEDKEYAISLSRMVQGIVNLKVKSYIVRGGDFGKLPQHIFYLVRKGFKVSKEGGRRIPIRFEFYKKRGRYILKQEGVKRLREFNNPTDTYQKAHKILQGLKKRQHRKAFTSTAALLSMAVSVVGVMGYSVSENPAFIQTLEDWFAAIDPLSLALIGSIAAISTLTHFFVTPGASSGKTKPGKGKKYVYVSNKQLVQAYFRLKKMYGRVPSQLELAQELNISQKTVSKKLIKINKERKKKGQPPILTARMSKTRKRRHVPDDKIFETIERYKATHGGKLPLTSDVATILKTQSNAGAVSIRIAKINVKRLAKNEPLLRTESNERVPSEVLESARPISTNSSYFEVLREAVIHILKRLEWQEQENIKMLADKHNRYSEQLIKDFLVACQKVVSGHIKNDTFFVFPESTSLSKKHKTAYCTGDKLYIQLNILDPKSDDYMSIRLLAGLLFKTIAESVFPSKKFVEEMQGYIFLQEPQVDSPLKSEDQDAAQSKKFHNKAFISFELFIFPLIISLVSWFAKHDWGFLEKKEEFSYRIIKLPFIQILKYFFMKKPANMNDLFWRLMAAVWSATFILYSIAVISQLTQYGGISVRSFFILVSSLICAPISVFNSFKLIRTNFVSLGNLEMLEKEFDDLYAKIKADLESIKDGSWTKDSRGFFRRTESYEQMLNKIIYELRSYSIFNKDLSRRFSNLYDQIYIVLSHLSDIQEALRDFQEMETGLDLELRDTYQKETAFAQEVEETFIPLSEIKNRFKDSLVEFETSHIPAFQFAIEENARLHGLDRSKWLGRLARMSEYITSEQEELDYFDQEETLAQEMNLMRIIGDFMIEFNEAAQIAEVKNLIDNLFSLCEKQGKNRFGLAKENSPAEDKKPQARNEAFTIFEFFIFPLIISLVSWFAKSGKDSPYSGKGKKAPKKLLETPLDVEKLFEKTIRGGVRLFSQWQKENPDLARRAEDTFGYFKTKKMFETVLACINGARTEDIINTLKTTEGNLKKAAKLLGTTVRELKMELYFLSQKSRALREVLKQYRIPRKPKDLKLPLGRRLGRDKTPEDRQPDLPDIGTNGGFGRKLLKGDDNTWGWGIGDKVSSFTEEAEELQLFLRDLSEAEGLTKNMVEKIFSISLSGKKLVMVFDSEIGAIQRVSPLGVIRRLNELKKDPRFKKLLKNLIIIETHSKKIHNKIQKYFGETNTEIMIFARNSERERLKKLESKTRISSFYIDDGTFSLNARYPLLEIVTIALGKYRHGLDSVLSDLEKLQVDLKTLNIKAIDVTQTGALIFTLLDKPKEFDKQELIQYYANLKRLLIAA